MWAAVMCRQNGELGGRVRFHFVASTGRTATTFLARALDQLEGVVACHEGYRAADKDSEPIIPLINLENRRAYDSEEAAREVVAQKRSRNTLEAAATAAGAEALIDLAYYNCTIAGALLEAHGDTRMVGILRQLEPFVRSATAISGEDPLPVGWADPAKPLTPREKFIALGRIRPPKESTEADAWNDWSAIMRNIWLWRETNKRLLQVKRLHTERVLLMEFEGLQANPGRFLTRIADHFGLRSEGIDNALQAASGHRNLKPRGYEVGPLAEWTDQERRFAEAAEAEIGVGEWLQ
jgi:hypothetical protein